MTATTGLGVTQEDIDHLLQVGLVLAVDDNGVALPVMPTMEVEKSQPAELSATVPAALGAASAVSAQDRYKRAYPIAAQLTSSLGLRGFRLNLAVERVTSLEELQDMAPKIREAVGAEKFEPLGHALYG